MTTPNERRLAEAVLDLCCAVGNIAATTNAMPGDHADRARRLAAEVLAAPPGEAVDWQARPMSARELTAVETLQGEINRLEAELHTAIAEVETTEGYLKDERERHAATAARATAAEAKVERLRAEAEHFLSWLDSEVDESDPVTERGRGYVEAIHFAQEQARLFFSDYAALVAATPPQGKEPDR